MSVSASAKVSRSAPGDSVSAERVPGDSAGAKWFSECRVISQYRVIHSLPGDVVNDEHARQIWWAPANSSGRQQIIQRPSGVTGAIGWRAFEFTNAQCNCLGSNVCHQCNAQCVVWGPTSLGFMTVCVFQRVAERYVHAEDSILAKLLNFC